MLIAHIDDSGTEGRGYVAVLAGFITTVEAWQRFSDSWRNALDKKPKLKYLRMVEARRRKDQFNGFSEAQRDARMQEFYSVIEDAKPIGIASMIRWEDFKEFSRWFESPVSVYSVLYNNIMFNVLNVVRKRFRDQKVEIVFDDQGVTGTKAASINDWATLSLSSKYRNVLSGRPVHRSDKDVMPLQAADVLAWHLRRATTVSGIDQSKLLPIDVPVQCAIIDRTKLTRMYVHALEMKSRFPHIEATYSDAELKAIRNKFLGYDPDDGQ
jgi:hypothetical protein